MAISRLRELRAPWQQQPQEAVGVDRDHPLGGALDALWLPDSVAPVDVIGGLRSSGAPSGVALGSAPEGRALLGSTSAGTAFTVRPRNAYPHVLVAYGVMDANNGWVLSYMTGDGGESILSVLSTGEVKYGPRRNYGTARSLKSTPTYAAGTPLCVIVQVFSDTDYRLYTNGSQANGTLSFGTGGTWLNSMGPIGAQLSGRISLLGWGFGTEALTDAQALAITANPQQELWRMFEPQRILVPVAAASGTTISAGVGEAAAAGGAAAISTTTSVSAAIGQASAAGSPAAVTLATPVAAGVGSASAAGHAGAVALTTAVAPGVGAATAQGAAAAVTLGSGYAIDALVGDASAGGAAASIALATAFEAAVGATQAQGHGAALTLPVAVAAGVAGADATGLVAAVALTETITVACGIGQAAAGAEHAAVTIASDTAQPPVLSGGGHSLGSVQRIAVSRERDPEELRLLELRQDDEALMRLLRGLFDSGVFDNEIEEVL